MNIHSVSPAERFARNPQCKPIFLTQKTPSKRAIYWGSESLFTAGFCIRQVQMQLPVWTEDSLINLTVFPTSVMVI